MKKARTYIIIAVIIVAIVATVIIAQKSSKKKRTRAIKDMYKGGTIYIYEDKDATGKYHYFDKSLQAVILADKKDVTATSGMVKITAVKTNENDKNYTRKLSGYVEASLLV